MLLSRKIRNHYIPRCYLNGFTSSDGLFFIFDKLTHKMRIGKPDNVFWEKKRFYVSELERTGVNPNSIEDAYCELEGLFSKHLKSIRLSSIKDHFAQDEEEREEVKIGILFFINSLYWRLPTNDEEYGELMKKHPQELGYSITLENDEDPAEAYRIIHKSEWFKKAHRLSLHESPFVTDKAIINSGFIFLPDGAPSLVGDNPIIQCELSPVEKFIFPASDERTFISFLSKIDQNKLLDGSFKILIDLLVFVQSSRFVCCKDSEHLMQIVDKAEYLLKSYSIREIRNKLFNGFLRV